MKIVVKIEIRKLITTIEAAKITCQKILSSKQIIIKTKSHNQQMWMVTSPQRKTSLTEHKMLTML